MTVLSTHDRRDGNGAIKWPQPLGLLDAHAAGCPRRGLASWRRPPSPPGRNVSAPQTSRRRASCAHLAGQMPLLGTKLRAPSPRRQLVRRDRLVDKLRADWTSMPRLLLVSAVVRAVPPIG